MPILMSNWHYTILVGGVSLPPKKTMILQAFFRYFYHVDLIDISPFTAMLLAIGLLAWWVFCMYWMGRFIIKLFRKFFS